MHPAIYSNKTRTFFFGGGELFLFGGGGCTLHYRVMQFLKKNQHKDKIRIKCVI